MTRLRLTISIASALAAVAAGHRAAAAETCAPVAHVSGDPQLVEAVVAALRERGIEVGAGTDDGRCGELIAVVSPEESRVRIAITDADGRTIERIASDADGAATAIETWAHPELTEPLLAARPAPAPVHTALAIDPEPPPREPPAVVAAAPAAATRTIELFAAVEGGLSDDGALWRSIRAQGCVTIRSVCAGAMLRHVVDTATSGDTAALGSERSAFDILLIAERPWSSRRLVIAPGVGIGLSSLRAQRRFGADLEDEYDESGALHLRASVAGAYRLAGAWALRVDLSLGAAPWAPRQLGELDGLPQDEPPLAGVPRTQGWLGLGVAYGGL